MSDVLTFLFGFTATAVWRRSNTNAMTQKFDDLSQMTETWLRVSCNLVMRGFLGLQGQHNLSCIATFMYSSSEMVYYGCCHSQILTLL